MEISNATITVTDVTAAGAFYARTLRLPVTERGDEVDVQLGVSTLTLRPGPAFHGAHHLAFTVRPEHFDRTVELARERVPLLAEDDVDVFVASPEWRARSVYFLGPDDIILEYIARDALADSAGPTTGTPGVLSLSEVGIGVDDVTASAAAVGRVFGLEPFEPYSENFTPVGDHDGLLILVPRDRLWFPAEVSPSARGPLSVVLGSGARPARSLALGGANLRS